MAFTFSTKPNTRRWRGSSHETLADCNTHMARDIVGRLRLDSTFKADSSGLTYQVVDREGEMAVVQVKGNARLAAFGSEVAVELNEKWTMREEDGRWKWCGSSP